MPRTSYTDSGRERRDRALAEVETLAWVLDNSIPIPGTGRRIGLDAIVGLVPIVGDLLGSGVGLFLVWRAARLGIPRVAVARMLVTSALDLAIGAIPVIGDAFDLWFKANTRNMRVMRRYLDQPDASTRDEWIGLAMMVGAVVLVVGALAWVLVATFTTVVAPLL